MSDHPLESSTADSFAASLRAMSPATAKVSMAETFYRAGYAAARAESSSLSTDKTEAFHRGAKQHWGAVLAATVAGLMVGASGMLIITPSRSAPELMARPEIAETQAPVEAVVVAELHPQSNSALPHAFATNASNANWTASPWLSRRLSLGSIAAQQSIYRAPSGPSESTALPREVLTSRPITDRSLMQLSLSY